MKETRIFFGTKTSIWQLFYYFPKKAEALKGIQAVLGFPELKILKPNDTRRLSHKCCVKAICKELPPLLQTLSHSSHLEMLGIWYILPFG